MNNLFKLILLAGIVFAFTQKTIAQTGKYKCMIQMNGYEGEKAYVIISLVDSKGKYQKTLSVLGPDKQWFNTLKEWYKFQGQAKESISAVTGASVGGGDRAVRTLTIDESKLDKGFKIRFESAVEEQKYYAIDAEVPFTKAAVTNRVAGKGYVKFVKISKVQ